MSRADVFISYKSEEEPVARHIREVLEANGISCWMAPDSIPVGSNYMKQIPEAIENCRAMIVVISKKSQQSVWVKNEFSEAISKNKLIIPYVIQDCELEDEFAFSMSTMQQVFAWKDEEHALKKIVHDIREALGKEDSAKVEIRVVRKNRYLSGILIAAVACVLIATLFLIPKKSQPKETAPEPAQAASKRRKSAVGKIEEAEKQPAKRRGRQTKAAVEEASKLAVKEKPIESAKKSKKTRKAEPVESAPAKSEPVQESVSAEEPVKKRRTRRSAEKKAEKQVELETEVEADALAEIEVEERSAEEKKPRKSRKSKLAKAEQPSLSDYELWNWDDEEEDEAANSDANSDDEFDDFDFDDDASVVASAASDSKPEPEPEPEPEPVASPPSQEAIALKEKMRRQKFIGTDHDRVDRLLLMVCDSYWLRACWEITPLLIDRVRSAMGRHWHTAEPVLRVFLVDAETKSAATHREHVLDLEIRGGIDNWYVPVDNPPSSFMVELGYRSRDGQFFTLISSNVVKTPQQFVHDAFGRLNVGPEPNSSALERNDAHTGQLEHFDVKASASRPELDPSAASFGRSSPFNRVPSSSFWSDGSDVKFTVDAEIVIKGRVAPGSSVSVKDEHIRLRPDGTFSVRYSLPERRHVFPVVATSSDGIETQTIVLAVDRNTKTLDPVFKEDEED